MALNHTYDSFSDSVICLSKIFKNIRVSHPILTTLTKLIFQNYEYVIIRKTMGTQIRIVEQ